MKQLFSLFILAIFATATSFAGVYKTALFGKDYNSEPIGSYVNTWRATNKGFTVELTNWNNNKNAWDLVKAGMKAGPSVATITTVEAIDKAIDSVLVTVPAAVVSNINSTKLYVASNATFTENVQTITVAPAKGELKFVVPKSGANLFYKFEVDCKKGGSNGIIQVSKLEYYEAASAPQKDVKSIAISGSPAKTDYYIGEKFEPTGYVVTATYTDETSEVVNPKWLIEPSTFTEAGNITVALTATYGGQTAQTTCPVTVKTIANTKETAYTVEQVIALIDAGVGLSTPVYVKGVVSKIVTPYSAQYKNISFNVSDDGAVNSPQFQFFRNQKDAKNTYPEDPNILVGASVIGYGTLTKYNTTYEFKAGNYLVEYIAPTLAGDINGDGVVNTSDVTALVNAVLGDGDVTLETGDLNDDGLLDVTDATMLIYLLGEEN